MSTMKRQVMMLRQVSFIILFIWMLCLPSWVKSFGSYKHQDYDPVAMRERYDKWVEKYGKQYKDRDEREKRFGIYASNVQLIDQVNSQNLTYKLTDNKFADLTNDEFKATYLGYRSPLSTSNFSYAKLDLHSNKTVDWRKKGVLPPIKDQGQCGSCWAFSAVSAVESINKIKTGKLLSLSEQELVDCDVGTGNEGCSGGFMNKAFQFVKQNGITTEENYPYKGSDGSCDRTKSKKLAVRISGYKTVPENSEKRLKAAVDKQPVSVAMDAGSYEFQLYSEGIFTGDCGNQLNHGVNAVGYGQVKGEDQKYWIVRNSWGIDWGESGYFRLERDIEDKEGKCGIAMEASYPVKDDDDVKNLGASSHISLS